MKNSHSYRRLLVGSLFAICLGLSTVAQAGYISPFALGSSDFSLLGTTWDPDPNTASLFTGKPPKSPGGATWSIMAANLTDASGFDSGHVGTTRPITDLGVAGVAGLINTALNTWAAESGFTNLGQVDPDGGVVGGVDAGASQASGGHLGDIRVAAWEISSPSVLAHAFQPVTEALFGAGGTIGGDVHIDVGPMWVDDDTVTKTDPEVDLGTVLLHELGHSLGLGHSNRRGSVMAPFYGGANRTLSSDDTRGIQALYGGGGDGKGGGGGGGKGKGKKPKRGGGKPFLGVALAGAGVNGVPEPSTFVLAVLGLFTLLGCAGRRRRTT